MYLFRGSAAAETALSCPMWWIGLMCVVGRASGSPLLTGMWNDTSAADPHNDTANLTDRYQRYTQKTMPESVGADHRLLDPPFLYDWLPKDGDVDTKAGTSAEYINKSNQSETHLTKTLTTRESSIRSAARTVERLVKPSDYVPSWAALDRDKSPTKAAGNSNEKETPNLPFLINPYEEPRTNDGDTAAGRGEDKEPGEDTDWRTDSRSAGTVFIHSMAPASNQVDDLKEDPAMSRGMPGDAVDWDLPDSKRTARARELSACVMWLGPGVTRECCVGLWYDWPTCHCLGFSYCDEGDVH